MNILIILAHPKRGSFNHSIAETCKDRLKSNGHEVVFHDLYLEGFNPILDASEIPKDVQLNEVIRQHCLDLQQSIGVIIVHPNWWGQPPAILKGWIDRVIRPGIAYEFEEGDSGEGVPIGLLKAHTALVFNTSNTSKQREDNIFKDPSETIWKNCIFEFCGVERFERKIYRILVTSDLNERNIWLKDVKNTIDKYFPKN